MLPFKKLCKDQRTKKYIKSKFSQQVNLGKIGRRSLTRKCVCVTRRKTCVECTWYYALHWIKQLFSCLQNSLFWVWLDLFFHFHDLKKGLFAFQNSLFSRSLLISSLTSRVPFPKRTTCALLMR